MAYFPPVSHSLGNYTIVSSVLSIWRHEGFDSAKSLFHKFTRDTSFNHTTPLLNELHLRFSGKSAPRILIDGLWFSRPIGGISRVWEHILSAWRLPGLIYDSAPVCLIERDSHLAVSSYFPAIQGSLIDPLDPVAVLSLANENFEFARSWEANVFISSWLSFCGSPSLFCPEVALVHDCLPERYSVLEPLSSLRRTWLKRASSYLAVSADTASDIETLLRLANGSVPWCHLAPYISYPPLYNAPLSLQSMGSLTSELDLPFPYIFLPSISAVGSYKNPELVASALTHPGLESINLLLSGISSEQRRLELVELYPQLAGRCFSAGFTDFELPFVYQHSFAVVVPSHIEGYGLPVVEALACGAVVLISDSRGLREAGANACLRFSSRNVTQLVDLLCFLLCPDSDWIKSILAIRAKQRISVLNPDMFGLALLSIARLVSL